MLNPLLEKCDYRLQKWFLPIPLMNDNKIMRFTIVIYNSNLALKYKKKKIISFADFKIRLLVNWRLGSLNFKGGP